MNRKQDVCFLWSSKLQKWDILSEEISLCIHTEIKSIPKCVQPGFSLNMQKKNRCLPGEVFCARPTLT